LRTVDGSTVSARSVSWSGTGGLEPGLRLARELGAGRILHGRLLRAGAGDLVRADLVVYRTADGTAEIRVPVEAPAHDVAALTDSVTWALVRNLWPSNRAPPVPTNALASASLSGLRAFLEGEIATAEGRWREAPEHFAEAIETDSAFWLAYARYVEAMGYRDRAVPRKIRSRLEAHLDDLPPRERAILEVGMEADELPEYLAGLRELVERRPDSWRAWFRLADHVIHSALFAGATVDEARSAIERAVSLHPQSSTLWQHAFWMALAQRDTAATGVAIRELDRLHFDSATVAAVGLDQLAFYRYLHGLAAGGDGDEPEVVAWRRTTADSLAAQLVRYSGPLDLSRISGSVSIYGSDRGEIALDRAVLRAPTGHAADAGALRALSQAWAGRGAWDSVMVALDRYVTDVDGVEPLRHAVRLVSVGRWLGALEPGAGAAWRAALDRDAGELDRRARDELAWLDGVAAFGARDGEGLDAARRRLEPDGAAATPEDGLLTSLLRSSLGAFQLALDGRTNAAADSLLAIERLRTNRFMFRRYGNARPYFTAINRLAAAEWLVENDRPAEAAPLLRWHEAVQFPADLAARADASLDGVILVWRGRAQAALGDPGRAREFYARALEELDAPSRELRPLVDAARRELDALGP
jgi:tetratricopeptide (TPR) repeat protein